MERFYSLDIKTQYVLQDSVRKDTFKSITTIEGVQWLMWTFYHWGIKYLTYDATMGLQLFHGRPVYDVNTKRWYGTKVVKTETVEDIGSNTTDSTNGEVNTTSEGDIHGDVVNNSSNSNGDSHVEIGNVNSEVLPNTVPVVDSARENIERGNTNDNGHGSNNHSDGVGVNTHSNDREVVNADTHSISSDGGIQPTVLGVTSTREIVEYTDKGNEPKGLSFYLHSLISSVFELSEGTAIELTTQAIEDDVANKTLTDGTIVEVSNNGITWFKRYFKSIEPNLSTKYCVYGGGRTKDTVRDMADVEYYQYMRYTDNKQSNTNTCNNGCGNCNNTTVKYESVRNTVDGRVVFADRGSLNK